VARRASTIVFAIVLVIVSAVGAAAGVLMARRNGEKAGGSVVADGMPVGTFSFGVTDCASGQAFAPGFFGVDLRGGAPGSGEGQSEGQGGGDFDLRVVGSGDDAELWLYPKGSTTGAMQLRKRDCSEWDVLVEWAGVTVNRVSTVNGHVKVACAIAGGKLTAVIDFERCAS
jgi:hypothetical protein